MSHVREQFRRVLDQAHLHATANIFDPLSARIAHLLGYDVPCVPIGLVGKVANLACPDLVLSNMSDVVDHCRRITRIADVSLMVDAEDGFGNAVNVMRTVKELEAAGVSAIEIEDNVVPRQFHVTHPGLVSTAVQVGKLKAAVAARSDPTTLIVARTSALAECTLDEALERIRAYADTGAEALMLVGVHRGRSDLEAVHQATSLPLCVLNPPPEVRNDPSFLATKGVRILMLGNPTFAVAVKAMYDTLKHLKEGGTLEALQDRQAPQDLLREVNRLDEFMQQQQEYGSTTL